SVLSLAETAFGGLRPTGYLGITSMTGSAVSLNRRPVEQNSRTRNLASAPSASRHHRSTGDRHGRQLLRLPKTIECHAFERFPRENCVLRTINLAMSSSCPCEMSH